MKHLTRRNLGIGIAASVVAIPVAARAARKSDPDERIKFHTDELEKAMADRYGVKVVVLSFPETPSGINPCVLVVAQMGVKPPAQKKENSEWVHIGGAYDDEVL